MPTTIIIADDENTARRPIHMVLKLLIRSNIEIKETENGNETEDLVRNLISVLHSLPEKNEPAEKAPEKNESMAASQLQVSAPLLPRIELPDDIKLELEKIRKEYEERLAADKLDDKAAETQSALPPSTSSFTQVNVEPPLDFDSDQEEEAAASAPLHLALSADSNLTPEHAAMLNELYQRNQDVILEEQKNRERATYEDAHPRYQIDPELAKKNDSEEKPDPSKHIILFLDITMPREKGGEFEGDTGMHVAANIRKFLKENKLPDHLIHIYCISNCGQTQYQFLNTKFGNPMEKFLGKRMDFSLDQLIDLLPEEVLKEYLLKQRKQNAAAPAAAAAAAVPAAPKAAVASATFFKEEPKASDQQNDSAQNPQTISPKSS